VFGLDGNEKRRRRRRFVIEYEQRQQQRQRATLVNNDFNIGARCVCGAFAALHRGAVLGFFYIRQRLRMPLLLRACVPRYRARAYRIIAPYLYLAVYYNISPLLFCMDAILEKTSHTTKIFWRKKKNRRKESESGGEK